MTSLAQEDRAIALKKQEAKEKKLSTLMKVFDYYEDFPCKSSKKHITKMNRLRNEIKRLRKERTKLKKEMKTVDFNALERRDNAMGEEIIILLHERDEIEVEIRDIAILIFKRQKKIKEMELIVDPLKDQLTMERIAREEKYLKEESEKSFCEHHLELTLHRWGMAKSNFSNLRESISIQLIDWKFCEPFLEEVMVCMEEAETYTDEILHHIYLMNKGRGMKRAKMKDTRWFRWRYFFWTDIKVPPLQRRVLYANKLRQAMKFMLKKRVALRLSDIELRKKLRKKRTELEHVMKFLRGIQEHCDETDSKAIVAMFAQRTQRVWDCWDEYEQLLEENSSLSESYSSLTTRIDSMMEEYQRLVTHVEGMQAICDAEEKGLAEEEQRLNMMNEGITIMVRGFESMYTLLKCEKTISLYPTVDLVGVNIAITTSNARIFAGLVLRRIGEMFLATLRKELESKGGAAAKGKKGDKKIDKKGKKTAGIIKIDDKIPPCTAVLPTGERIQLYRMFKDMVPSSACNRCMRNEYDHLVDLGDCNFEQEVLGSCLERELDFTTLHSFSECELVSYDEFMFVRHNIEKKYYKCKQAGWIFLEE